MFNEQDIIQSYSADQAMADGYLTDVGDIAKEAGFNIPVRITAGVFGVVNPNEKAKAYGQDYEGRLWDLLWMASLGARKNSKEQIFEFSVLFQNGPGNRNRKTVRFFAALDFTSGPAIHIFLPEEY